MNRTLRWLLHLLAITSLLLVFGTGCQSANGNETIREQDYEESESDHEEGKQSDYAEMMPDLEPASLSEGERLRVVATTSIVADAVRRVGGEQITLMQLIPLGVDVHAFEATPRDLTVISDAHVVFINGAGLETFLDSLLESAEGVPLVPVSAGIDLLPFELDDGHVDEEEDHDDDHGEFDPHVWFDPSLVAVWVNNIEEALSTLDPQHAGVYHDNAEAYEAELRALDDWIRTEVARIPEENRLLVTDHALLTYFAARYGFAQVGAVIPATTTLAEPSAQELAALVEAIQEYSVPAIFVGHTISPRVSEQITADLGIKLVFIHTGSFSEADGPVGTYLEFMRYNVDAIVGGLR